MKKIIFKIILAVLLILVILIGIGWTMIDSLVKAGVEKGGSFALGVETTVNDIDLSILKSRLVMDGLKIANPKGFETPHLMDSGRFDVEVKIPSLITETIELKKFELDGLDVNIEQKLTGNNISKVMANLKRFGSGEEEDEERAKGRKLSVDRVVIKNVVAHIHLAGLGEKTIKMPEIELTGVTSDNAKGIVLSELTGRIVTAVLAAIVENRQGTMPDLLASNLTADIIGATQAIGASELVEQVGGEIGSALREAAETKLGEVLEGLTGEKKANE